MAMRRFGNKRSIQQPTYEELRTEPARLTGEFAVADVRVEGGDFAGTEGDGEIERAELAGVNLSETRWRSVTLVDTMLSTVDISNAVWTGVTARRVELVSARATGFGVSIDLAWDVYIADCRLDYATIRINRVKGWLVFERCTFAEARIVGDLSRVLLVDCELAGAEFDATNARDCDLRGSRLADARGISTLKGATISPDQLVSVADRLAVEAGLRVLVE